MFLCVCYYSAVAIFKVCLYLNKFLSLYSPPSTNILAYILYSTIGIRAGKLTCAGKGSNKMSAYSNKVPFLEKREIFLLETKNDDPSSISWWWLLNLLAWGSWNPKEACSWACCWWKNYPSTSEPKNKKEMTPEEREKV